MNAVSRQEGILERKKCLKNTALFCPCFFLGHPLIYVPPVDQYEINNGSSAVFQCEASAIPLHDVFWTFTKFNGSTVFIIDTTLPDTDKYKIRRMRGTRAGFGELTVLNVQYEDRGTYACTAMNIIGSDMSDANLTVHGESPSIVLIIFYDTELSDEGLHA